MSNIETRVGERIPALAGFYDALRAPSETLLRVICGAALMVHGFPKIMDPFRMTGMVENLGFYPGAFWSPLLAATEFLGGLLLVIGLFTRPAALAATVVLLVTVYFHWVVQAEGFSGAEKSILWAAITFFFFIHGANKHSVDHKLGRQF
ncbi:DoxX family protein [Aureimonas fodinaquatilis]|uniref:DoxX family protein n=1 Tax=Aureimonas fodinaquatilis TaxID=2565783 RepID=A0A5B0DUY5_9HYPH|nr:DoxX family protein [Aureimonas fodinaquatilis]KAA0970256.1 DoxX family protein [Aureimonas fodinaquatilis]